MSFKACAFAVYFGDRPGWYDLWKLSALRNPQIDFFLFTDIYGVETQDNIHILRHGRNELNETSVLAGEGLRLESSYKICDFRPLFGEIFSDLTSGYDYWGWFDLDILLGNLTDVLGSSFGRYDYIATGRDGASGPLAFLRNSEAVNALWRTIPDVHAKLNDASHYALDERDYLDLVKREITCDLVFRECMDDLPARWVNGNLESVRSGQRYALHHFGGTLTYTRQQIVRDRNRLVTAMAGGRAIRIGKKANLFVEEPARVLIDNTLTAMRSVKARLRKPA